MRIVSLVASATEIVAALGLEADLVGVSADSDWPPSAVRARPILNTIAFDPNALSSGEIDAAATASGHTGASLYHVDGALLRSLRPDLVLTQEMCAVCSVSRHDVEQATELLGYTPRMLSLNATSLDEVLADIERVASAADVPERGGQLVAALRQRLEHVATRVEKTRAPRVLCLEWLDPPWCAGHWIPRMVDLAGGRDELGFDAGPSRQIEWQAVVAYAPEVVVLMPCSVGLDRVAAEWTQLRQQPGWDQLAAMQTRRVYAGNTDLFARAGPRLVDGVEALARMFDPARFSEPLGDGVALRVSDDGSALDAYK